MKENRFIIFFIPYFLLYKKGNNIIRIIKIIDAFYLIYQNFYSSFIKLLSQKNSHLKFTKSR